ncbi:uncharacterized protein DFL_002091 [Arthrobotrys flagrans]|uniref:Uncharacterized protein n=1 Tax=Arthrobotrys flagrans TaxID=97331 RepID=A0A437A9X0_ARTFL|nr:hypothetical protein DFL_002091 [Arthrobotrys flagrans]
MPRSPPKHLTLLLPPPYRSDYQIARSPTYFSTLHTPTPISAYASEKYPSPIPISARTLTPGTAAGTIIFDSTTLYTPTSPAKPCIYANYLPADEYTLHRFIRKEREEHFRRLRQKWGVLFYWVVGLCVIIACGIASATFSARYTDSGAFEMLFPGLMTTGGNGRGYTRTPEVLMVSNGTGYAISMPLNEEAYPLPGEWYRALCDSVEMKSMAAAESRMGKPMAAHLGYYEEDKGYEGLELAGGDDEEGGDGECERTMTFVVDDWEGRVGGVGEMVMGLWMAYALAIQEKREFFVVGKKGRWAYGDINKYFDIPPPTNKCTPPAMSRSLPCPRNTPHRLVTPATFKDAFGHAFENQFEDAREVGVKRQHKIFEFLRTGYEAIPLKGDLQTTIMDRVHAIGVEASKNVVAVQIRHGDRGAREWTWHKGYLPLERFMKVSLNMPGDVIKGVSAVREGEGDKWPKDYYLPDYPRPWVEPPVRIISSDDSDVFDQEEIKSCSAGGYNRVCVRAQDRSVAVGQPGGFWAEDLNKMEREEREAAAVAYLVDFGVQVEALRVARDGWVVCGYYGDMCRMLAVGMGWESAIEKGHWVNIDGDFDWFGMRW